MRVLWLTGLIVVLDQATKMLVVQTMYRSQSIPLIGDWLSLTYTENPGMAFGITFGPPSLITFFSIFATVVILVYLVSIRKGFLPYRVSLAFVLGGALGNIIDRVFYGAIIYGEPFFQGRVVDFIHVDVWRGYLPDSIPLLGGKYVALFPIWNVADMTIVVGVVGILVFQRMFHDRQSRAEAIGAFDGAVGAAAGADAATANPAVGMPTMATGVASDATKGTDARGVVESPDLSADRRSSAEGDSPRDTSDGSVHKSDLPDDSLRESGDASSSL